jgi:O-antigen/teichoic acid export membrane protein
MSGSAGPIEPSPAAEPAASSSSRLRRNALANILGRAASAALWLLVTPFVLERLGHERFGIWALLFALSGYVGILDFGMAGGVSRFVAMAVARGDRDEARRMIARSLVLSGALGCVWLLVFTTGSGLFLDLFHVPAPWHAEVTASLIVFGISVVVLSVAQVLQWSLMGFQRFDLWNYYFLAGLVVNVAVMVAGLLAGQGLMATALAALAAQIAVALLSGRSVLVHLRAVPVAAATGARGTSWGALARFGGLVQASNALGLGHMQVGRVLLGTLGALVGVTRFELAFRVTNALWSLATLIQNAAYPAAAHAHATGDTAAVRGVYYWCCRWVFLMAGWTLGLVWVTSPVLFHLWLGTSDPRVVTTARWLVIAFGFSTLAGPATPIVRGIGIPALEVLHFGLAFACNVVAGVLLIPRLGPEGAAISMAVGFCVASAVLLLVFHSKIGVSTPRWVVSVVGPRLGAAGLAALGAGFVVARFEARSRGDAAGVAALGAVAFTLAFLVLAWPSGDPKAAWVRLRGRLRVNS